MNVETNTHMHARSRTGSRDELSPSFNSSQLLREIQLARQELSIAEKQFEYVTEPMLIDRLVFRIAAAQRQLDFLLRMARENNINLDDASLEWIKDDVHI